MECLQALDRDRPAQVEEVLARADIARSVPLSRRDMCQGMLDGDAFAERDAPRRRGLEPAKPLLKRLIVGHAHQPPSASLALDAVRPEGAGGTRLGIELHRVAGLVGLLLARRT